LALCIHEVVLTPLQQSLCTCKRMVLPRGTQGYGSGSLFVHITISSPYYCPIRLEHPSTTRAARLLAIFMPISFDFLCRVTSSILTEVAFWNSDDGSGSALSCWKMWRLREEMPNQSLLSDMEYFVSVRCPRLWLALALPPRPAMPIDHMAL
jgi:hypothetical protein